MYIHKTTHEVLEGVISKGIDWLEIPKGAVVAYYFDGNDPDGDDEVVFYNTQGFIYDRDNWYEIESFSLEYRDKWAKKVWELEVDEVLVLGGDLIDDGHTTSSHKKDLENTPFNPLDVQEGGSHYKDRGIQPVEYTEANKLNFQQGNVVKYITRHKEKNGVEDLGKVVHYALLEAYFTYGIEGSTKLKQKILKMVGESD